MDVDCLVHGMNCHIPNIQLSKSIQQKKVANKTNPDQKMKLNSPQNYIAENVAFERYVKSYIW